MRLYYTPGACSLSPHIVAREADIPMELCKVDLASHTTADGVDYYNINSKGYVPALQFDGGEVLTEGPAIVQFLADQKPDTGLMPQGIPRYRVQEWLSYLNSEVHKAFGPLFMKAPEPAQEAAKAQIGKRFDYHKLDTAAWPKLRTYQQRVAARPAVHAALSEEGLLESK